MKRRSGVVLLLLVAMLAWCRAGSGDVLMLTNGGRVVGEILNPDQSPRTSYVIKTAGGGQITLAASQVREVLRARPDEIEYEKIRPRYPDTVEGQWALAEWCREHLLLPHREKHLKRILELDSDHEQARRGLGYSQVDGQWMTQEEAMTKQGYRRYKGRWRLPQEIELMEEERKQDLAEKEWIQKLNRWRSWLFTDKDRIARENILGIDDPLAVKALALATKEDPRDQARILFIEATAGIGTPAAKRVLALYALEDPIEEVRLTCLDYLKEGDNPDAVTYFIGKLRSKNNVEINRAGAALRQMGNPSAIGPLIDALVTTHKFKVSSKNPGQISTTFGTGSGGSGSPGGLSLGGGPKIVTVPFRNRAVLDALVTLSEGTNYGFDVSRWKAWYTSQKKYQDLDARRD